MIEALFPRAIEHVAGVKLIAYVGHGTSRPTYVQDSSGRVWIQKTEAETGPAMLLAEALGWLLGSALGVPVAEAGVCLAQGERSWLSGQIEDVLHWDRNRADQLVNHSALGAMLVLDLIIMNGDRNEGNLLLQPDPNEAHLLGWAIDAANANVAYPKFYERDVEQDTLPDLHTYVRGLPLNAMRLGAAEAAIAAAGLPRDVLGAFVNEACEIANESDGATLLSALHSRCARAPKLLPLWLAQLEARP